MTVLRTMRDSFIERIIERMKADPDIFFLSGDFGAPALDYVRTNFKDRFINVGIAEQNLISVASGLALEGYKPIAYAIAPFLTMRAFEQIRNNISLLGHYRKLSINIVGVGAGLSYDVSGPTHHCLEDISVMRTLPKIEIVSPSDWIAASSAADYAADSDGVKYFRLDSKPLPAIYSSAADVRISNGFNILRKGGDACIVSTGFMTQTALAAAALLDAKGIHVEIVDLFRLKPLNEKALIPVLKRARRIFTIEEGFVGKGGLDSLILSAAARLRCSAPIECIGIGDSYVTEMGPRDYLHTLNGMDAAGIAAKIAKSVRKKR